MKIYTRKGDEGSTGLIGGTRVPKSHIRIEAYGTIDELNSFIGLVRDYDVPSTVRAQLIQVQEELFTIGSHLANDEGKSKMKLPEVHEGQVERLENAMDTMNEELPDMRFFVLPGGHQAISTCHIARCVCRRAERLCVAMNESVSVNPIILKYLNRLSDYLFVLSRYLTKHYNAEEVPWKP